jgi:hypothetical protein
VKDWREGGSWKVTFLGGEEDKEELEDLREVLGVGGE